MLSRGALEARSLFVKDRNVTLNVTTKRRRGNGRKNDDVNDTLTPNANNVCRVIIGPF